VAKVCAIVLAAGSGSRFGGLKQFEDLGGRPVLEWSMQAAHTSCDKKVVLVGPPDILDDRAAVPGGVTRSESVRAGLAAVPPGTEIVVVHDSARPFASPSLFARVVAAVVAGADGAVPVIPVTDTIKQVNGSVVCATLDRSTLVAVQTPQAFRIDVLRAAHASGGEATDDAALVESVGGKVVTVEGDRRNLKLTTRDDLVVAWALLRAGSVTP
jgi:2-C-methyl-D-erythritol 4-phosphate cytidylyltransferase